MITIIANVRSESTPRLRPIEREQDADQHDRDVVDRQVPLFQIALSEPFKKPMDDREHDDDEYHCQDQGRNRLRRRPALGQADDNRQRFNPREVKQIPRSEWRSVFP